LYSAFTYFCGFKVNSGEYKLMGLAPYGTPVYAEEILDKVVDLKDDGSFRLDLSYFNYCQGLTMTSKNFDRLFGGPPRAPETSLTQREMDLAASVQKVTEEIVLRAVTHLHKTTGMKNLCLAGGVALNCVGNGRILREGPFERLWIQPAAGDAGGALGAALYIWHQLLDKPRTPASPDGQKGSLLGPRFSDQQILAFLETTPAVFHHIADDDKLDARIVDLIEDEKVVGLFQGRMEFGPRALGCRSIIGDARSRKMQSVMNLKIKFRESFRPFAPIVLRERVSEYFEMEDGADSPYMLLVADVAAAKQLAVAEDGAEGLAKLKSIRSVVPAITHVDNSARVQTVDPVRHARLHRLMTRFAERTGCPVMINTSFNVRGEPIVCAPEHAYHCFMGTDMDVLVLENFLLLKEEQPKAAAPDRDGYLAQFELD
jgi:carbamoyltransferase